MLDDPVFFDGWSSLLSILISVPFVYLMVVAAIRIAGIRSMSKLNNFDWVVTVAIGTIAASSIVRASVTVLDAAVAIGALLVLQMLMTKAVSRSPRVEKIVKADPVFLLADGEFLHDQLRAHRLSEGEVRSVLRKQGFAALSEVRWVILEADAQMSVIAKSNDSGELDALVDVPPASDVR